jgi:hypothetical protein
MNKLRIPLDHLTKGGLIRQLPEVISGAEENGETETEGSESENTEEENSEETEDESEENEEDEEKPEDVTGLKTALDKERKDRKAAEKLATKLQKEKDARDQAKMTDIQRAQAKEKLATEKVAKLASGLLIRDQNAEIKAAAEKLKFIDPADAIDGVNRSKIIFTQDEDDPSDITIDVKSVEKLVKELSLKKPHFITSGTDDGQETGGQFGGSNRQKKPTDDALKEFYPSL